MSATVVGVPKETFPGETRVALVPSALQPLLKKGVEVLVERGAGTLAGYHDAEFEAKGAKLVERDEIFSRSQVILQVRAPGANTEAGRADVDRLKSGQIVIGQSDPLTSHELNRATAEKGVALFALELVPRITRAQSMDVLSSMATLAGYKAVLMAANRLPRIFPMLMTAAGSLAPARVLILGAGVMGLQAIATSRRLGAVVLSYDVRPAVKEQVQSLGAKFVELELETGGAEDRGGYAKAMGEEFYQKQREQLARVIAGQDVVISTAAIPGRKAPLLVTADAVRGMTPGSVIVDMAAERGGNCELTKPGEEIIEQGVVIMGPLNVPATLPYHASQMFAKNVATFLLLILDKEGQLAVPWDDDVVKGTLLARDGQVVHPQVREAMGL